jgi:DNA-binding NtrC family response regulator
MDPSEQEIIIKSQKGDYNAFQEIINKREQRFKFEICDLFGVHFCGEKPFSLKSLVEELEKSVILKALQTVKGNQKEAAKLLGVKYATFHEKVKRYKIRFEKNPLPYSL